MSKSQLRDYARDNLGEVSADTEARYEKIARRVLEAGGLGTYTGRSRRTWYEARAAIKHTLARDIRRGLNRADQGNLQGYQDAIEAMVELDVEMRVGPPAFKICCKSKRNGLGQLPPNWQECILSDLPPAHRLPWAVQMISGCRTAELAEKGPVQVRALESKGQKILVFEIAGAKLGKNKGQRVRRSGFVVTSGPGLDLWRLASGVADGLKVQVDNAGTYRNAVRRAGKRIGLKVSPYSARHAFAAAAKAQGVSEDVLALAMGHQATGTQQHYGLRRQGRTSGGHSLVAAKGSDPVRVKNRGQNPPFRPAGQPAKGGPRSG